MSHNVQTYDKSVYLRVADARRCKVAATMLMPLYETAQREHPFGVFEVCQAEKNVLFPSLVDMLRECLAAVGLWTVDVDKHAMGVGLRSWPRDFDASGPESASAATQGRGSAGGGAGARGEADTHCSADSLHQAGGPRGAKRPAAGSGAGADSGEGAGRGGSAKRTSPSSSAPSCGTEAAEGAGAPAARARPDAARRPAPEPAAARAGAGAGAGARAPPPPPPGGGARLVRVDNRLELNWAGGGELAAPGPPPWAPERPCGFEAMQGVAFGAPAGAPELPAFLVNVFDSHVAHMSAAPLPGALRGGGLGGGPLGGDGLGGGPLGGPLGGAALGALGGPALGAERPPEPLGADWPPAAGGDLGLDFEDDDDCTLGSQDAGSLDGQPSGLHNRAGGGAGNRLSLQELQAHFSLGLREAANRLGICPTTLKARARPRPALHGPAALRAHAAHAAARARRRAEAGVARAQRACRRHGIQRWPRRQLAKLSTPAGRADASSACEARAPDGDWAGAAGLALPAGAPGAPGGPAAGAVLPAASRAGWRRAERSAACCCGVRLCGIGAPAAGSVAALQRAHMCARACTRSRCRAACSSGPRRRRRLVRAN